ncbi:MAG: transcriptional regulator, partial [Kibdelosporangium sp.]
TKPYRLNADVDADFINLHKPLRERRARAVMDIWGGPLLPRSSAPGVCAEREATLMDLRSLVIERGDLDTLWSFVHAALDQEALEALERGLSRADPRRGWVESQLRLCMMDD